MTRSRFLSAGAVAFVLLVTACEPDSARITGPKGQEAFNKYVALGTSVSMGYQSAGVYYSTQQSAWPALLAHQAFATSFTTPEIQGPGCYSPLIAPLSLGFRRLSGGTIQSPAASDLVCALVAGITLPTNNVAVDGATTYAALRITPESVTVAPTTVEPDQRKRLYRAVLAPGKSQVTSMMAQNPTLVSVELGANEALRSVTDGFVVPATRYRQADGTFSYYPFNIWQPQYDAVVDSIAKTGAKALLVSVPLIPNIVGVYPGNDFYKDSVTFASFGINVSSDCNGNPNSIFAFTKVLTALGSPKPNTFSCTDNVNPAVGDFILTPADVSFINAVIIQMNNYIQSKASGHGWAYLDLNTALASFIAIKQSFSLSRFLGCTRPFGQFIALDGVHPSLDGQQAIANAAADALNLTYDFEIPRNDQVVLTPAQMCSP